MSRLIKISATGEHLPDDATTFFGTLNTETNHHDIAEELFSQPMTQAEAVKAIADLNAANHGGANNWRLGLVREHVSDMDRTRFDPMVDPSFHPSVKSRWYWTEEAVPEAWSSDSVFVVGFYYGNVINHYRYYKAFVRAVRSVAPAGQ